MKILKVAAAVAGALVLTVGFTAPAEAAVVRYVAKLTPQFGQGRGQATARYNGSFWTAGINARGMTQNTYTYAIVLPDGTEYDVCSFTTAPDGSGSCNGRVNGLTLSALPDGTNAFTLASIVPTTGGTFHQVT